MRMPDNDLRFVLGMAQMAAASVAAILLIETGVSSWALAAVLVTCALTTTSVLLFGARRPPKEPPAPAVHHKRG